MILRKTITEALIAFYLTELLDGADGSEAFTQVVSRTRRRISGKEVSRQLQLAEEMARKHGRTYVLRLQQELDAQENELHEGTT